MSNFSRQNNFDLIRLFAAFQVVLWHAHEHIDLKNFPWVKKIISYLVLFPGVPIFFFISGFLIYDTYDRKPQLKRYFKNRFLRLFPGLWSVFILTFIVLFAFKFIDLNNMFSKPILGWSFGQLTLFQFYTPEALRGFGVGTPNGSLWTIVIEFSFYCFVPLLFLFKKHKKLVIYIFILLSLLYNQWYSITYRGQGTLSIVEKLMGLNLMPYLFYFLIGVLFKIHWNKVEHFIRNKGVYFLMIYVLYHIIFEKILHLYDTNYWPNTLGLIGVILLSFAVFSLAYTNVSLSEKLLKGNDISYGLYLYHMPIINTLLMISALNPMTKFIFSIVLTMVIALCSWKFVEKPALKLK